MVKKKTRMKKWEVKVSWETEGYNGYAHHYSDSFLVDALNAKSAINKVEKEFHKKHMSIIMGTFAKEV